VHAVDAARVGGKVVVASQAARSGQRGL
jgi:hypothetical protein